MKLDKNVKKFHLWRGDRDMRGTIRRYGSFLHVEYGYISLLINPSPTGDQVPGPVCLSFLTVAG